MADKKLPRHKRMYKDSPKLERGEGGEMKSVKPSDNDKRGENPSPKTDGEPDMEPNEDARIQEIKDMHSRHQTEMKSIHSRHSKEDAKKYAKTEAAKDDNESAGAGDREIEQVRKTQKITE